MPTLSKLFSSSIQSALGFLGKVDELMGHPDVSLSGKDIGTETPYEKIKRWRANGSIQRVLSLNGWMVFGADDVQALFRDKRLSNDMTSTAFAQTVIRSASRGLYIPTLENPHMQALDAPDHTRLRKLSAKGFTNRFVQGLAPKIEKIVDELLNELHRELQNEPQRKPQEGIHTFDVVDKLAKPLPAIVIAEMLGVPIEERHLFEGWSADLLGYTELTDSSAMQAAIEADLAMRIYLEELTEDKRKQLGDDLLSKLIQAEEDNDSLTPDEIYSTCMLILVAGHETTTRLIGSCLYLLLKNPDQLESVQQDRSLLPNAIEEALRVEPPILAAPRMVKETFTYKDVTFRKGQFVVLSIAGFNHDPQRLDNADAFDASRDQPMHLSFGHGIHQCLGMPLARLEAEIALNKLFDIYPDLKISEQEIRWEPNPFFRGLEHLFVDTATKA